MKYSLQFASKHSLPFVRAPVPVHILVHVCVHVLRGHGHAVWMQTNSIGVHIQQVLDMRHGHGQLDIQNVHMQHGHGDAAWTWRCSVNMEMQNGYGLAAWTWK